MLILIDGYNVIAPVAPPQGSDSGWLRRERERLIVTLAQHLPPRLAEQTCVVFDSARFRLDQESTEHLNDQGIEIQFSVGYDDADQRIEELIREHSTPKRLTVVSSDHRIQATAKRRGATACDSEPWLDRLRQGNVWLAPGVSTRPGTGEQADATAIDRNDGVASNDEVQSWIEQFGLDDPEPDDDPIFPKGYGEDLL